MEYQPHLGILKVKLHINQHQQSEWQARIPIIKFHQRQTTVHRTQCVPQLLLTQGIDPKKSKASTFSAHTGHFR